MNPRQITYAQSVREALEQSMERDSTVFVMGLGVTDPKGVFGTTLGLEERFGPARVFDMPTAENGMTGVAVGAALVGMRPVMVHQRVDFTLLALDQIVNNAAKWYAMFDGQRSVPITIRMILGRGWGQGPQHSQMLQAMYGHFPGLKVVMPSNAYDAKGLLQAAIADPDPVIYLEHRWLHNVLGVVPPEPYTVPLGAAQVVVAGTDVSIVATSFNVLEAIRASEILAADGISAEVVDVRSIKPLDRQTIVDSVRKTGRMLAVDSGWQTYGVSGELVALAGEHCFANLKTAPVRLAAPDTYVPTSAALADTYYLSTVDIVNAAGKMFGRSTKTEEECGIDPSRPKDVPDVAFRGPF